MIVGVLMPTHDYLREGLWERHSLHPFQETVSRHGIERGGKVKGDLCTSYELFPCRACKLIMESTTLRSALGAYHCTMIEHTA